MDEKAKKKIVVGAAIAVVSGAAITGTVVGVSKLNEIALEYNPRYEHTTVSYGPANNFPSETNSEDETIVHGFN